MQESNTYLMLGGSIVSKHEGDEDILLFKPNGEQDEFGDPVMGAYKLNFPKNVGAFDVRARLQKGNYNILVEYARIGLMRSLLPGYLAHNTLKGNTTIARMYLAIAGGDMDGALRLLQEFLSTVPYCDNTNYEGHYQQLFYIIFSLFGMYVDVEVRTPKGRVDVVMRVAGKLYVIELKLGRSAEAAMAQINLKQYPERFSLSGLQVVKVGINFDVEKHTLGDWVIEE